MCSMYFTNRAAQLSDDDAVFFTSAPGSDGRVHVGVSMWACLMGVPIWGLVCESGGTLLPL